MRMIEQQHPGGAIERPSPFGFTKHSPKQSHGREFRKPSVGVPITPVD